MAILTGNFTDWSRKGSELGTWNRVSPNTLAIKEYILNRWPGTKNLGNYGVRKIRGGRSYSTHSFGAAQDIGFPSREVEREITEFLINNSKELGIQAVHAYGSAGLSGFSSIGYIWRSNRSDPNNQAIGWKKQRKGGGMGSSWAMWVHYEVSQESWYDGSSVESRIGVASTATTPAVAAVAWPVFDPKAGLFGLWPLNASKPTIEWGDAEGTNKVEATRYLQGVLNTIGHDLHVDGDFGPSTHRAVRWQQGLWELTTDGQVGPVTWRKVDASA
jgi:peptidoglycan hydrolase-like protein with peptidoglycan-binding domain